MKKVRITVMRQTVYRDLIEEYENPIMHACNMRVGQVFIAEGWKKPDGMWRQRVVAMSPFVMTLAHGGEDLYDGWMKNKKSAKIPSWAWVRIRRCCCNNVHIFKS